MKDLNKITQIFADEILERMAEQGHRNTGQAEKNTTVELRGTKGVVLMPYYVLIVDAGIDKSKASFKQVPHLKDYFKSKGLPDKEATSAAFATVKVWMMQGASTKASKRFSKNKKRNNFILAAAQDALQKATTELTRVSAEDFIDAIRRV